ATNDPQGGGYNVGWTSAGEWLAYTVTIPTAGLYDLKTRLVAPDGGATFHLEVDDVNVTGPIAVPDTDELCCQGRDLHNRAAVTEPPATGVLIPSLMLLSAFGTHKGDHNLPPFNKAFISNCSIIRAVSRPGRGDCSDS